MWLADFILPSKEDRFQTLLQQHADLLKQAASAFNRYLTLGTPALSEECNEVEKKADQVLAELTGALRDAFVTPIDRQDIYNLGEAIDDMIDYLNNAAREFEIFKVSSTPHMRAIAEILEDAASAVDVAVRSIKSKPEEAWKRAREAQHAENMVEQRYRIALAELFEGTDVSQIFKQREIYRHLSNSADKADAIGRLIGKIVVKTT